MTAVAPSVAPAGTGRRLAGVLPLVPAFAVAAIWIAWATHSGGYFPVGRYPGALVTAALLLTLAIARPPRAFVRSAALVPFALVAAWTAFNGLSLAWTGSPDGGWDSVNELLTITVMAAVIV